MKNLSGIGTGTALEEADDVSDRDGALGTAGT